MRHLAYFAGLGEVVAEGLDCLALPGHENLLPPLLKRVFEEIRGDWDTAQFGFVDASSPFYGMLRQALTEHGSAVEMTNHQSSAFAELGEGGWDAYLKERSGNFRKNLKHLTTTALEVHQMSFREAGTAEQAADLVEDLLRLHAERWPEAASLFVSAGQGLSPATGLALVRHGPDGAAGHGLQWRSRRCELRLHGRGQDVGLPGQLETEHIKLSPGKLIMAENFRRAFQRHIREIDLLPGNHEYKSRWTQEFREVFDLEAINPSSLRGRLFQWIRTVKRAFERMIPGKTPRP